MHKNIIILGIVSLLTDISSEMIYPLIPLYLTAVLGASPAILGVIEGIAESLASLLKVFSGHFSDKLSQRKPLAITGYGLSAVSKILFILATSWTGILWARIGDRFGKGIRTAPRDALIADVSGKNSRGKAFGLHRAMDTAGAVIGILIAYLLFIRDHNAYMTVFAISIIPALIAVACLFFTTETGVHTIERVKKTTFAWSGLDQRLKNFLIVSFIFNLGNSSNQFLLLRAQDLGFSASQVILLYLLMNVTYFIISYPAGLVSDKIGRRATLVAGYLAYGLVYIAFGWFHAPVATIILFGFYGLYMGITDGSEKALLADIAPPTQKATVYGLHAMIVGVSLLPASILAGLLWNWFGVSAPFYFGGVMGIGSALAFYVGLKNPG